MSLYYTIMESSFEEEMMFSFDEEQQSCNISIFNTNTTQEANDSLYCGFTKPCVC